METGADNLVQKPQTVVEQIAGLINRAQEELHLTDQGNAKREFALTITALEDAGMRYTRGLAIAKGCFSPADLEKTAG